ncbi:hypothetical protein AAH013_01465 [Phocaeicola dorei]|uniref:hypothetical protein n=1 Tax=Bacteroidales TaxID=171549 RepID=UPI0039B59EC1
MRKCTFFKRGNPDDITYTTLFIFFMYTCYNGIYLANWQRQLFVTFGAGNRTKILTGRPPNMRMRKPPSTSIYCTNHSMN